MSWTTFGPVGRSRSKPSRRRLLLPVIAGLGLVAYLSAGVSAAPGLNASASVAPNHQPVRDSTGTTFKVTVNNTGTVRIAAVEVARPSPNWRITACPTAPAGWTAQRFYWKCRFVSGPGTANDLQPGAITNAFRVRATTTGANNDFVGRWRVVVSRTTSFSNPANLRTVSKMSPGLIARAHTFVISNAIVTSSPRTPGSACPAATIANHSAVTSSGGHTLVICGRNRANVALTPTAFRSSLDGTFISGHGAFTSGSIRARSGNVVLGNWSNVVITGSAGPNKTVVARIGSSSVRTSALTTLGGYAATNEPPVAADTSATTNEDTSAPITLSATDPNGDVMTFTIVSGPAHGTLGAIVPAACPSTAPAAHTCTATVAYSPTLNYNGPDSFTYRATDSFGAMSGVRTATLAVTSVNDQPSVPAATFGLAENSANGTAVGTATTSDVDTGQTHSFSIEAGNTGGAFAINGTTGAITVANSAALDFETTPSFALTVRAADNGSPVLNGQNTVTINLTNSNETPAVAPATLTLAENSANATAVGTVVASDPDAGQTLTFSITGGNTGGAFAINGATGAITVADTSALDFETTPSFSLTVRATDNGSPVLSGQNTITVNLTDANEAPTVNAATFSLAENSPNTTAVGTVSATDPDAGQTLTYSITAGNTGGAFAINGSTGAITVADTSELDFETTPAFALTVRATDNGPGTLFDQETVTVNLTNANEAPTVNPATFSLAENSANSTAVGTVSATDPDAGQTLAFSITGGNTGGAFAIHATTGAITVANSAALDFETTPSFTLVIRATDDGLANLFDEANADITITNASEAPTITTTAGSVAYTENAAALLIDAGVTVTEPDSATLVSANVVITANCTPGEDVLALASAPGGGIVDLYTAGTCTLSLSGSASVADYQAALRTVTYANTSDNPVTATRTATFTVDDGPDTDSDTRAITVSADNDAPDVDTSPGSASFTEGGAPVAVDPAVTVADAENLITSATVQVTTGCEPGQDVLALTFASIFISVGSYVPATCLLTLSGGSVASDYQAALRDVTYGNTSQDPATAARTLTFTVDDGDDADSDVKGITVISVNDDPVVDTTDSDLAYTEGNGAVAVDPGLVLSDVDGATITAASIQILGGCTDPEDELALLPGDVPGGVTVVPYIEGTCILQLTGSATLAAYQAALRDVLYENASNAPDETTRVVRFDVVDANADAGFDTRDITVTSVNTPPVVTATAADLAYTENAAATPVDTGLVTNDPDSANVSGAGVQISTGCTPGQDVLALASPPVGITTGWVPATCALNLFGTASFATYQAALRAVTYQNTSEDPSEAARVVTFTVNDGIDFTQDTRGLTVTAVNDAPLVADKSHAVSGNVSISVAAGSGVLVGVTDPEGDGFSAAIDAGSLHVGDAVINANGSYTFNPEPGRQGLDTVTFEVCDDAATPACASAELDLTVSGMIWFVDNAAAAGGDGRIGSPFDALADVEAINGNADGLTFPPRDGDTIFLYASGTAYTGGLTLEANQRLVGAGATATLAAIAGTSIAVDSVPSSFPTTGGTRPTLTGGVVLATNNSVRGVTLGAATTALSGSSFGTLTMGSGPSEDVSIDTTGRAISLTTGTIDGDFVSVDSDGGTNNVFLSGVSTVGITNLDDGALSGASGDALAIVGGSGSFTYTGSIAATAGNSIDISGMSGGTVTLTGAVNDTGGGIRLVSNTGATIILTGTLTVSTGANAAFTATGGGTVTSTAALSALTTTSGRALDVQNTTIGAANLVFRSISANGGTTAVLLSNTGSSGGVTVTGNGTFSSTGGTIQNTSGDSISLANTLNVSLTSMHILTSGGSGVSGTGVTNFSFVNGTISNSGNAGFESNIAFNSTPATANNIAGTLTVTGSTLTNAFYSGIDVQSGAGTVTSANLSNNTITSTTSTATSTGFGISFNGVGTASTVFSLTDATIDSNTITNFPSAAGIQMSLSNSSASGPGASGGSLGSATNRIDITNNAVHGASSVNRLGTNAITFIGTGGNASSRVTMNGLISGNNLQHATGHVLLVGNNGYTDMTATVTSNTIIANNGLGSNAISGGNGVAGAGNAWTPDVSLVVSNNNISATDGNGILLVGRGGSGTADFKVQNNTVAAPTAGFRQGIRIDAGNAASSDDDVCVNVSGNTSAGFGGALGIGIRKEGSDAATNAFGIHGLAVSPATGLQAAADVAVDNPAGGGVDWINGSNFVSCTLP